MQPPRPASLRHALIAALALAAIAAAGWLAYVAALDAGIARMQREANDRLALIASTFDATVARYRDGAGVHFQPSEPSLEDVFIDLMSRSRDNFQ